LAVAASLVVVVTVIAVTPARDAVARWFGIGSTQIEIVPTTAPGQDAAGTSAAEPGEANINTVVGATDVLEIVQSNADPIPALGLPETAFDGSAGRGRSYVWAATDDLLALPGSDLGLVLSVRLTDGVLDGKRVVVDVAIENVLIGSPTGPIRAIWIAGSHDYLAAGTERAVTAERVLLWEVDGLQYRLESRLTLDASVELAQLVVGGTELLQPG
jgi:hypothetical protein